MEDIEDLIQELAYIPGHFHLELNLNGDLRGPAELRQRDVLLRRDSLRAELELEASCLQYAVRNLLGLLDAHLEQLDLAEETFRSICKEDPGNLNAWANLGFVYERQGRELDAGECVDKVSQLMGLEAGEAAQDESRLLAARCLAEQAYAQPNDVELQTDAETRHRLAAALTLYNRALDYGGALIPLAEKRSWFFKMATIYVRLDGILQSEDDSDYSRLSHYNKGLRLLAETLQSDRTQHKALSWCYIGILLERQGDFPDVPMAVHDCGFSGSEPLTCYGTAMELASDDALILNQLARVFYALGKQDMAMGVCNMALSALPDPELNWQAYCSRAKINVMSYVRDLELAKEGEGGVPDRQALVEARADLERVVCVHPCLQTHLEMAQVLYYMGVDALQERLLVDEGCVNSALVSLSQALQCPPGPSVPALHLLRGRCLLLKGEEQNAVTCFQRALELGTPPPPAALRGLLEALLALFCLGPQPSPAILQMEEALLKAEQLLPGPVVQAEVRALCRAHMAEVTDLSRALIQAGRMHLVRRLLDAVQPKAAKKRALARSTSL